MGCLMGYRVGGCCRSRARRRSMAMWRRAARCRGVSRELIIPTVTITNHKDSETSKTMFMCGISRGGGEVRWVAGMRKIWFVPRRGGVFTRGEALVYERGLRPCGRATSRADMGATMFARSLFAMWTSKRLGRSRSDNS
jgi:hypothetical protein